MVGLVLGVPNSGRRRGRRRPHAVGRRAHDDGRRRLGPGRAWPRLGPVLLDPHLRRGNEDRLAPAIGLHLLGRRRRWRGRRLLLRLLGRGWPGTPAVEHADGAPDLRLQLGGAVPGHRGRVSHLGGLAGPGRVRGGGRLWPVNFCGGGESSAALGRRLDYRSTPRFSLPTSECSREKTRLSEGWLVIVRIGSTMLQGHRWTRPPLLTDALVR